MAEGEKITTSLVVDVTDFKKGLSDANRYIRLANSEFENATAGMGKWSDSADGLRAKLAQLERTLEGQEAAAATLRHEYDRIVAEQGETSKGAQELAIKLNKQEAACKKTASQLKHYQGELDGMEDSSQDAEKATTDLADAMGKAEKSAGNLIASMAKLAGKSIVNGIKGIAAAGGALVTAFLATGESSKEWIANMNKLDAVAKESGRSTEAVRAQFQEFYGILGDETAATTTASNLEAIGLSQKNLESVTNSMAGIWAKYGDSIPLDGLAESINETSRVGAVTGGLADALNWAGINEDEFNEKLAACSSEAERQQLIVDTLDGAYGALGNTYKEQNANIIESNKANAELQNALAGVGNAAMPVMSALKMMGASILSDLLPNIQQLGTAFKGVLSGDTGAAKEMGTALSGIIQQLLSKVSEMAPALVQVAISLITNLTTSLLSMLPQLTTVGVELISTILFGLTSAIPQITAALVAMIPQLTAALVSGIPQLIEGAVQFFLAIVEAIPKLLPPLISALPQIVMSIIDGLLSAIPSLIDGALEFLLAIVDAIPLLVAALVPLLPEITTTIVLALLDATPQLLDAAVTLLLSIVEAIPKIIVELVKALPKIWQTMKEYLSQLPSKIWAILTSVVKNFTKWGTESREKAKQGMQNLLEAVRTTLKDMPAKVWAAIKGAIDKVATWGGDMLSKAKEGMGEVVSGVVDTLKDLPSKLLSIGSDLVKGLWNGISDMTDWIIGKIKGFGENILGGIKDFFGIGSPSKVMAAEVGKWLPAGMADGITSNTKAATKAMANMAKDALGAANSALSGGVNIPVSGGAAAAGGRAAGATYVFNQYNNSPKALSRADIYRQTKNQLRFATANA